MGSSGARANTGVSRGWAEPLGHAVKTFVVAFVVLQAKEWFDAGRFDTPATAVDAALIAAGIFVLYAVQRLVRT